MVKELRDGVRKVTAQMELKLGRDAKGNKKGFYKYINYKSKTRENAGPLLRETGDLVTQDSGKASFYALARPAFRNHRSQRPDRKAGARKMDPW